MTRQCVKRILLSILSCFISFKDRGPYRSPNKFHTAELSPPEMITLSCGVLVSANEDLEITCFSIERLNFSTSMLGKIICQIIFIGI